MNTQSHIDTFLTAIQAGGKRPDVVRMYGSVLRRFAAWLGQDDLDPTILTVADVQRWAQHLQAQGRTPPTIYRQLGIIRVFSRWAHEQGRGGALALDDIAAEFRPSKKRHCTGEPEPKRFPSHIDAFLSEMQSSGTMSPDYAHCCARRLQAFAAWLGQDDLNPMQLTNEDIARWEQHLVALGRRPSTVAQHRHTLRRFSRLAQEPAMPAPARPHIDAFLAALQDGGSSYPTVQCYARVLRSLAAWLGQDDLDPELVTSQDLAGWRRHLLEQEGRKLSTVNSYLIRARRFCGLQVRRRRRRASPQSFTTEELAQLVQLVGQAQQATPDATLDSLRLKLQMEQDRRSKRLR
ncbi:MAG: site-specific integrase [Chloroflexi bacterium]|nr:site-specific integrase [Chloroflexota bacterium]MBU1749732.1 site-specific integrase [Chloroflexota bacterium]